MNYRELESLVIEWANEKQILKKGTTLKQGTKTNEEALELIEAIADNNKKEVIDALGDILVTIIIQAKMQNVDLLECLESAYNEIKGRKGELINGIFVKDK